MRRRTLLAASSLLLAGCAGSEPERPAIVFGSARWDAAVVPSPEAVFVVYLADASGPEPPLEAALQRLTSPEPGAELVAYDTDQGALRSPHFFSLPVPAGKLDPSRDYVLRMAVVEQGRPVLVLAEPPLVLTRGRPRQVDVALTPAS